MIYRFIPWIVLFVVVISCVSEEPEGFEALSGPYLGQEPPGAEPKLFMPGLVSTHDLDGCVAFLDDAKVMVFYSKKKGTLYTYQRDGYWTSPKEAPFQNTYGSGTTDFTAGPDGRTLFFQSSRPTSPEDTKRDTNTWAVEWTGSGWTDPYLLPPPANTDQFSEGYPSVSQDGSVYFFSRSRPNSSMGDIYRSRFVDDRYLAEERLGSPINSTYHEVDPVVAPDGSYILFASTRPGGVGLFDLYMIFRRNDGGWSHPHNVGKEINELIIPIRMSVTPDGKYFFFLSNRPTTTPKGKSIDSPLVERWGDRDVYWVSTGFIHELARKFRNKKCAAEAIESHYNENGLEAATKLLMKLYADESYYFELSELITFCGRMIETGKLAEAERFYEVLSSTHPDKLRIKQGYAVAHILHGSTQKGLELLKGVWSQYPSMKPTHSVGILSYYLSSKSKDEDALRVLEFGALEIGTFAAYLELAEAQERLGQKKRAVQSCKKALDLKPDHADALALLEKLEQQ